MPSTSPGYVDAAYLRTAGGLFAPLKQRSYALLRACGGQSILDVGCGPGLDTLALASLVGEHGTIVGIDADHAMAAAATEHARRSNLRESAQHAAACADRLPFASDTFDGCRSERLFMHLTEPQQALREMVRVTRPGGWIVVVDSDWGTLSIDTPHVEVERQLARLRAERLLRNGYSGRQLARLLRECGVGQVTAEVWPLVITESTELLRLLTKMDEVEHHALETGALSAESIAAWRQGLSRAGDRGVLFATMSVVIAAGQVPH